MAHPASQDFVEREAAGVIPGRRLEVYDGIAGAVYAVTFACRSFDGGDSRPDDARLHRGAQDVFGV